MVQIIRPGKVRAVECPKCRCLFSFEDEDVVWGNQMDPMQAVRCPCCNSYVDLYEVKEQRVDLEDKDGMSLE